jgi:hypothetical protein
MKGMFTIANELTKTICVKCIFEMNVYQIQCLNIGNYDIAYENTQMYAYLMYIGLVIWMTKNPR